MTILRHTLGNIGGVNPVQYIFKEDIASFIINPITLFASITLKSSCSWNYLYGSPESIQVEGKEEDSPAGMKYNYQIKMLIPKDRPDVEVILRNLKNLGRVPIIGGISKRWIILNTRINFFMTFISSGATAIRYSSSLAISVYK